LTILASEKFTEGKKTLGSEKILGPEKTLGLEKTLTTDNVWVMNSLSPPLLGLMNLTTNPARK
jgi:hypothetical protein